MCKILKINKKYLLFLLVIFLLCLFLNCLSTNYDYDLFARLIVGERFLEYYILPFKDFLSYTPTHNWYDHEWGSGVVFYFILKYFGAFGIILLQAILMFFTAFFILKTQRLQKHSFPNSLIFTTLFLVLFYKLNTELIRCQMFSFFFFSLFLYILEKSRTSQKSSIIWLIPFLTIIWNNLHGGVVSGLGLIFMYFIGAIIEKKDWKKYFLVLLISTPLLIINPYGYKYLNFLFSATTMQRKYVIEWWPVWAKYHMFHYLPTSIFILLGTLLGFFYKKLNITKVIVLLVTLILGFLHVKLLSIALITVCALCYNEIFSLFIKLKPILKKIEKSLYLVILILTFTIPLFSPTYPRVSIGKYPITEVEFLKINDIKGNLLTSFGFGSFVSYKLYPNNLIYMDGRYEEVYNNEEFLNLKYFELVEKNWNNVLKKYPTEILMINKTIPVYEFLKTNNEWREIYTGLKCGIFVKKENVKNNYINPNKDLDYYKKTIFNHRSFK